METEDHMPPLCLPPPLLPEWQASTQCPATWNKRLAVQPTATEPPSMWAYDAAAAGEHKGETLVAAPVAELTLETRRANQWHQEALDLQVKAQQEQALLRRSRVLAHLAARKSLRARRHRSQMELQLPASAALENITEEPVAPLWPNDANTPQDSSSSGDVAPTSRWRPPRPATPLRSRREARPCVDAAQWTLTPEQSMDLECPLPGSVP
jgi:hypothetical protein